MAKPRKSKAIQAEADRLFSLVIRARDGKCRRCLRSDVALQCHHLIPRVYRKVRYEPDNAAALCYGCHKFLTHRPLENDDFVIELIGEKRYLELREIARATAYKVDLKEVLEDLRAQVKAA